MKTNPNHLPGPPHNPGLAAFIRDRHRYVHHLSKVDRQMGFMGWYEDGYLAHRDEPGLTQFITFRLHDTLPKGMEKEWSKQFKTGNKEEQLEKADSFLDRGFGSCLLLKPECAQIMQSAFIHFHGDRYLLKGWCIMPNHIHVLILITVVPMWRIVKSWKEFTAREINKLLGQSGPVWSRRFFDVYMRDEEQEQKTVDYIDGNPNKAKLVKDPSDWPWSSARHRDAYKRLVI